MKSLIGVLLVDVKSELVNSILDEAMRDQDVGDCVLILGRNEKGGNGEEGRPGALAFVGDADDTRTTGGGEAAASAVAAAIIFSG